MPQRTELSPHTNQQVTGRIRVSVPFTTGAAGRAVIRARREKRRWLTPIRSGRYRSKGAENCDDLLNVMHTLLLTPRARLHQPSQAGHPPRLCRSPGRPGRVGRQSLARAASRMRSVTADGRETIGTCEDRTSAIVAPARLAMNRWVAGGMARSSVAMRYHEMNGARFVHDQLELAGWQVAIADAQKVKGLAPLACKTDRIDAWVLAELSRRDLVPRQRHRGPGPHRRPGRPDRRLRTRAAAAGG